MDKLAADYPRGPHDQPQSMCPAFGSLRVGLRMRRVATILSGSACCVYGLTFTSHFYGARRTVGYVPFNSETLVTGKLFEDIREAVFNLAKPEDYDTIVITNLCVPTASGVPLQLLPKEINGVRIIGIDEFHRRGVEDVMTEARSIVGDGETYVTYDIDNQLIKELPKQPESRFVDSTEALLAAGSGFVPFGLDPTRGQLLALQIQVPTLEERIQQGQETGYTIIALGIVALLLSLERFITLTLVGGKVKRQIKADSADPKNPLGRVLQTYYDNKDVDSETLMLKIDEAILKEQPAINARISFIKIISMVAPLLGLLGTVIGMILTFQAITLFGTGDPKTMAGGISSALMTTVLGLCVAIPTVLLHSIVSTRANGIMHILNEQSAGLIAEHAEKAGS